ncbi:MAG: UDP-2,3-diacylglucosamine diphosphatase [Flavobacteriales bacterium]|nr:UDP-2,3-diacylglucosamine diphosphatase [Flavobacteriales bacterium]MCX7768529.1 UDP-2,3-diacylglucosamine diphosphatase [Flavobacteriales bacterium]MDW8410225.1 UDP-2,3-diacylglucosamine diphosphatase [Flavobacteriales bacterium]
MKRELDLVVISDVHLGTYGCHASELLAYLKSIQPKILILNGDIIDIWNFSKNYWPKTHMQVVNRLLKMMSQGVRVYYITGNHDEMLRRFTDFHLANFSLVNKLVLDLDGKKTWFFHGDVFDPSIINAKWLAKIGGKGYDLLILINRTINNILTFLGKERVSFSRIIKNKVKRAVQYITDFENTALEMAVYHSFDTVVCGHIHQPGMKSLSIKGKKITYLNSGDWVENLTALEYHNGHWSLFSYALNWGNLVSIQEDKSSEEPELVSEFLPVIKLMEDISGN